MCNPSTLQYIANNLSESCPNFSSVPYQALVSPTKDENRERSASPSCEEITIRCLKQLSSLQSLFNSKSDSLCVDIEENSISQAHLEKWGNIACVEYYSKQTVSQPVNQENQPCQTTLEDCERLRASVWDADHKCQMVYTRSRISTHPAPWIYEIDQQNNRLRKYFPSICKKAKQIHSLIPARPDEDTAEHVLSGVVCGKDQVAVKKLKLNQFFRAMPKCELHNHLVPDAHDNLEYAASQKLWFEPYQTKRFYRLPESSVDKSKCQSMYIDPKTMEVYREYSQGLIPLSNMVSSQEMIEQDHHDLLQVYYNTVTMPKPWNSGSCSHFYKTFDTICSVNMPVEEQLLAEVKRALNQNVLYSEIMVDMKAEEPPDLSEFSMQSMKPFLEKLKPWCDRYAQCWKMKLDALASYIQEKLQWDYPLFDPRNPLVIALLAEIMRTPTQSSASHSDPLALFFAEVAAGLTLHKMDPARVVGINIVGPEHSPFARLNFEKQMEILDFLYEEFQGPNIALHAGELTKEVSSTRDMDVRISRAIKNAKRIGHGTCIAESVNGIKLMEEMKQKGVLVEICLSSSKKILGVKLDKHPISAYMERGVPISLGSDDPHILRTDLAKEYRKAALKLNCSYKQLKEWVRNSLEYSFLPGESIFQKGVTGYHVKEELGDLSKSSHEMSPSAKQLAGQSLKAALQMKLEREFSRFERDVADEAF